MKLQLTEDRTIELVCEWTQNHKYYDPGAWVLVSGKRDFGHITTADHPQTDDESSNTYKKRISAPFRAHANYRTWDDCDCFGCGAFASLQEAQASVEGYVRKYFERHLQGCQFG